MTNFSALIGETLTDIKLTNKYMFFECSNGKTYIMEHDQMCCECVIIESIVGDLKDLIGTPIVLAEESTEGHNDNDNYGGYKDDIEMWTFYKLATVKGYVTIRWHGEASGYYSASVDFLSIEESSCPSWLREDPPRISVSQLSSKELTTKLKEIHIDS